MRRARSPHASGRVAPWLAFAVALVTVFLGLRLVRRSQSAGGDPGARAQPEAVSVEIWDGALALDAVTREGVATLEVRLAPLHADPEFDEYRARRMAERYGLGDGTLWRLLVRLDGGASEGEDAGPALEVGEPRVHDEHGEALRALHDAAGDRRDGDPLLALLAPAALDLVPGETGEVALWGRAPGGAARLELRAGESRIEVALQPSSLGASELPRWFLREVAEVTGVDPGEERVAVGSDLPDPRDARIAELEAQLEEERRLRHARELEWYDYNRAVASLDLGVLEEDLAFALDPDFVPPASGSGDVTDEEAVAARAAEAERERRTEEVARKLSTLLRLEGPRGLDLLEPGRLEEGRLGPVVFRLLDERGRLAGSLSARSLRLEASRAARTLTVVLEDGFESAGGERTPFEPDPDARPGSDGVRRIVLPEVDPEPWIDLLPELFSPADLDPEIDDGLWDLYALRREVNRLLALETSSGWYRLRALGGVDGDELREVHLEELDHDGRLRRRLFADRMRLEKAEPGVALELEGGAVLRGEEKRGFREGRLRILFLHAPEDEWAAVPLPGWTDPPDPGAGASELVPGETEESQETGAVDEG